VTTIIFSPHQDDETLACGGMIIKKSREGKEIYIIFLTDGRNSHKIAFNIQENPTPEEIKEIRKKEAKEVAEFLGIEVKKIFFLDFEDGTLKDNISKANALVTKYLIKLKPTEVFVPHQYDIHEDHSSTNTIVLSAIKELHLDLDVYEYIIWSKKKITIRDMLKISNLIKMNISDIINLKYKAFHYLKSQVKRQSPSQKKSINLIELNISDIIDSKNKAIDMYKSQVDILFPSQKEPIMDDTFLSNFKKPKECFLKYRMQKGHIINQQAVLKNK